MLSQKTLNLNFVLDNNNMHFRLVLKHFLDYRLGSFAFKVFLGDAETFQMPITQFASIPNSLGTFSSGSFHLNSNSETTFI